MVIVCILVTINAKLDESALKDLKEIDTFKSTEGNTGFCATIDVNLLYPRPNTVELNNWTYAIAMYEILLCVDDELKHYDDFPLSVNDAKKMHIGIRKSIEYGLKPFLLSVSSPIDSRLPYIITSSKILLKIVKNTFFPIVCTRSSQQLVYTDLVSSIFMVVCNTDSDIRSQFEEHLRDVQSKLSHGDYFKILFLIMGSCKNTSSSSILHFVHTQLMQTLYRPGSFVALCDALLPSITSMEQDEEIVKKRLHGCTTISSIIGKKGHSTRFYNQIIDEIFEHFTRYVQKDKSHQFDFIDAAVQSLRRLYMLQSTQICRRLNQNLFGTMEKLASPDDLVAGAIVCEANQFTHAIHLIHLTFCATGPSDDTLPSELLSRYMPLFIQIYHILIESKNALLKNELLAIIIRCLSNRSRAELNQIIEMVLFEDYAENIKHLHVRIKAALHDHDGSGSVAFSINTIDTDENAVELANDLDFNTFLQGSLSMVHLLKQSNHNTLVFNTFLHLLQLFLDHFCVPENPENLSSCTAAFVGSENEFKSAVEARFKKKYAIINALNELILFKQFHGQFVENSQDMFAMLNKILAQQINRIEQHESSLPENIQEILVVILLCVGEFLERIRDDVLKTKLMETLQKLNTLLHTDQIRSDMSWKIVLQHLDNLLNTNMPGRNSDFTTFKHILSDCYAEPYTKVYGIMNIIKLIEAKDEETCSNAHIILVLSLKLLKESEDSYIFLNSIKLLIALFGILGDTVLDALISEYHCDIDSEAADIDFKLKVGETIVKVIQGLGEMSYKYKDPLLNCFLRGIYSKNDDLRTSNMSNLGAVLRILSYQVHHFFEEVKRFKLNY